MEYRLNYIIFLFLIILLSNCKEDQINEFFLRQIKNVEDPQIEVNILIRDNICYYSKRNIGAKNELYHFKLSKRDKKEILNYIKSLDLKNGEIKNSFARDQSDIYFKMGNSTISSSVYEDKLGTKLDELVKLINIKRKDVDAIKPELAGIDSGYFIIPKGENNPLTYKTNFTLWSYLMSLSLKDLTAEDKCNIFPAKTFEMTYLNESENKKIKTVELSDKQLQINYIDQSFCVSLSKELKLINQ